MEALSCQDEESIDSGEFSSDDDYFVGIIDTSTLRKTAYPSAGNQSNQATPASKQVEKEAKVEIKVLSPAKEATNDSESDTESRNV